MTICSTCHKQFLVLSPFMTYHRVCNYSNTTGATSGTGTSPSRAPLFTPSGVRVTRSLAFCVVCCRSLFVLFLLVIVLAVRLQFTVSAYLFGIFTLLLLEYKLICRLFMLNGVYFIERLIKYIKGYTE